MRSLKAIGWFSLGAGVILGLAVIGYLSGYIIVFPGSSHHVELLSIFLGAATLVVTAVGVVVALGAVFGYVALKDEMNAAAERAVRDIAGKSIDERLNPAIQRVEAALQSLTRLRPNDRTEDITAALAEKDDGGAATDRPDN